MRGTTVASATPRYAWLSGEIVPWDGERGPITRELQGRYKCAARGQTSGREWRSPTRVLAQVER